MPETSKVFKQTSVAAVALAVEQSLVAVLHVCLPIELSCCRCAREIFHHDPLVAVRKHELLGTGLEVEVFNQSRRLQLEFTRRS